VDTLKDRTFTRPRGGDNATECVSTGEQTSPCARLSHASQARTRLGKWGVHALQHAKISMTGLIGAN
jgi:hypothetical protein